MPNFTNTDVYVCVSQYLVGTLEEMIYSSWLFLLLLTSFHPAKPFLPPSPYTHNLPSFAELLLKRIHPLLY